MKKNGDPVAARPAKIGRSWPAAEQNSEQSHNIKNERNGQQVVLQNHLTTPALVVIIVSLSLCFGLALSSFYISQMAEREARLAQYDLQQYKEKSK